MPRNITTIEAIKLLKRPIFTSREISDVSGKTMSATTQSLNYLQKHNIIKKIYRGVWAEVGEKLINPYLIINYLFKHARAYVSFLSALHLYGIIEQIPQIITLASTAHTRKIKTAIGVFEVHQISPLFFDGFDWYKGTGDFLVAEPEKALADCLYLYSKKKNQFGYFPEFNIVKPFSIQKVKQWLRKIPGRNSRVAAEKRLGEILRVNNRPST